MRKIKLNNKVAFLFGILITLSILIGFVSLTGAVFTMDSGGENYNIYIEFPLPQKFIIELSSVSEIESIETFDDGYSVIRTNISTSDTTNIADLNTLVFKYLAHSIVLTGGNFDGFGFQPFSCAKDVITGNVSGIYIVNGVLTVDSGDTQGKCP